MEKQLASFRLYHNEIRQYKTPLAASFGGAPPKQRQIALWAFWRYVAERVSVYMHVFVFQFNGLKSRPQPTHK